MNLTFRNFEASDISFLVTWLNNENVTRYLSSRLPSPYTEDDALWWINQGCKEGHLGFIIEHNDMPCGVIGIYLPEDKNASNAEIGYWIAEEYWGKGVATTAVRLFVEYVFLNTSVSKVFNPVTQANIASIKVMQKAGFVQEKIVRHAVQHQGKWFDEVIFVKTKPDS